MKGGETTSAAENLREGNVDHYVVTRAVAGTEGAMLYDVVSRDEDRAMLMLDLGADVPVTHFDPSSTLRMPTDEEKNVVVAARDHGKHERNAFAVYDLSEGVALCTGPLYGWDPLRIDLLACIVRTLRTARDGRLFLMRCTYETVAAVAPRQVRFMSPVGPLPDDVQLETRYFEAFQQMLPRIVRGNFMAVPPIDEEEATRDDRDPLMWSVQMHASPEVREVLEDIVTGRIDSLDAAQQALDAFGAAAIVRKRTGWGTHRGLVRDGNEDALILLEQTMVAASRPIRLELYGVADGMGGHEAGEIASEITLKSMAIEIVGALNLTSTRELGRDLLDHEFLAESMSAAVEKTNQTVRAYAGEAHSSSRRKPGSTLVCALTIGPVVTVCHVGDSRAYKIGQDGSIERVTRDHSPVQKLVDFHKITAEQAFFHPHRHQISSNIGIAPELLRCDVNIRYLREGEGVLMCSDGLNDMLQDPEIEELCRRERDPRRLARSLVEAACDHGGHDNVTVVVVTRAPGPSQEQRETPPKVS
jgi:serine/threonine protein phosphatase PrpC